MLSFPEGSQNYEKGLKRIFKLHGVLRLESDSDIFYFLKRDIFSHFLSKDYVI